MSASLAFLIGWTLLAARAPQDTTPPILEPGPEWTRDELGRDAPPVHSPSHFGLRGTENLRGLPYRFAPAPGTYTLELRSITFDPHLILRPAGSEEVLAEDDDGLGERGARLVVTVPEGGAAFDVWVVAKAMRQGFFEVRARVGDLAPEEEEAVDPRTFVQRTFEIHGMGSRDACNRIYVQAFSLQSRREHRDALTILEQAIGFLDPADEEHGFWIARYRMVCMTSYGVIGRPDEAVRQGLLGIERILSEPILEHSHASQTYNLAYWMWRLGRYEEGLAWAELGVSYGRETLPPEAAEHRLFENLLYTYQRSQGIWDDYLATLEEPRTLAPGETLAREMPFGENLHQATPTLRHGYSRGVTRFDALPFRVEASGTYTLDLRSFAFDAFLVLRAADGTLLAEDDDGRGLNDARLVVELEAGIDYLLEPTSLHGGFGPYCRDPTAGRPEDTSGGGNRERRLAEAEACLRFAEETEPRFKFPALLRARSNFQALGHADRALEVSERLLALRRERYGPGSQAESVGQWEVANSLRAAGRSVEAVHLMQEVYDFDVRKLGVDRVPVPLTHRLAELRWKRGERERAQELFDLAEAKLRKEYGEDSREYVDYLEKKAFRLEADWLWAESLPVRSRIVEWYERERALRPESFVEQHARALHREADAYSWTGGFEETEKLLREALALWLSVRIEPTEWEAGVRELLAWTLAYLGRMDEAVEELERVEELFAELDKPFLTIVAPEIYCLLGKNEQALEMAGRLTEHGLDADSRGIAALPDSLRFRRLRWTDYKLALALGVGRRVEGSEKGLYELALGVKGVVGQSLVQSRESARAALSPEALALTEELQALQSELSQAFHGDAPRDFQNRLRDEIVAVQGELRLATGGELELRRVTSDELLRALPPGAVLIDYHVRPQYTPPSPEDPKTHLAWNDVELVTAWVLRAGEDRVHRVELGEADELRALAAKHSPSSKDSRGLGLAPEAAKPAERWNRVLAERLWDPLATIVGDAPLVFVSASDFLGGVPLAALQGPTGRFLVEDHTFVALTDAAELVGRSAPRRGSAGSSLLTVGDVDYRSASSKESSSSTTRGSMLAGAMPSLRAAGDQGWTPLPFTRLEIEEVARLFAEKHGPRAEVEELSGAAATEAALERELGRHTWVHIATHGFFDSGEAASMWHGGRISDRTLSVVEEGIGGFFPGLLSGLVLAGASRGDGAAGDDGLLTAEELTWLDLEGCELVALSACETGLGSARGGAGLIGLRRAFHHAGARSVLASAWSVEDEATSRLMRSFYRYLWIEELPRAEALRQAQLDLLGANRREHGKARPSTWGAFVLSGEWR